MGGGGVQGEAIVASIDAVAWAGEIVAFRGCARVCMCVCVRALCVRARVRSCTCARVRVCVRVRARMCVVFMVMCRTGLDNAQHDAPNECHGHPHGDQQKDAHAVRRAPIRARAFEVRVPGLATEVGGRPRGLRATRYLLVELKARESVC